MKKFLLLAVIICAALFAKAQSTGSSSSTTYHAFKVDVGLGYAIPSSGNGTGIKAGVIFNVEPQYRLSDDVSLGLRAEGAAIGYQENIGTTDKTHISLLTSFAPTFEYYLMHDGFRPFAGAGAGIFSQESLAAADGTARLVAGATRFGFFPRVGFEAGHFRAAATYNIIGSNSNYLGFTIGVFFGGGKK